MALHVRVCDWVWVGVSLYVLSSVIAHVYAPTTNMLVMFRVSFRSEEVVQSLRAQVYPVQALGSAAQALLQHLAQIGVAVVSKVFSTFSCLWGRGGL